MLQRVNHRADLYTQMRQFVLLHGGEVRTYQDVAATFNVYLCPSEEDPSCDEPNRDHTIGFISGSSNVHWRSRKLTRPGLRKFLKLVAQVRLLNYQRFNIAMRIYAENAWATTAAQRLRVRFPTRYSQADRAQVRWLVSKGMPISPQAKRWANR